MASQTVLTGTLYMSLLYGTNFVFVRYVVEGGMQDFNYLFSNCMELTIEVSCCKYPLESELQTHWGHNKESLLSYLEVVQGGVRGLVKDLNGQPVPNAVVEVNGIQKNITTSYFGEYWRLLAPGKYWSVILSILLLVQIIHNF